MRDSKSDVQKKSFAVNADMPADFNIIVSQIEGKINIRLEKGQKI